MSEEKEQITTLSDIDKLTLEIAKYKKQLAAVQVEKTIAQHESAEMAFKYLIYQLYVKYGLTNKDAIDENGNILYNKIEEK
jgi:hypothetical protein